MNYSYSYNWGRGDTEVAQNLKEKRKSETGVADYSVVSSGFGGRPSLMINTAASIVHITIKLTQPPLFHHHHENQSPTPPSEPQEMASP